ncbi:hypothetical protein LB518_22005 [Mesorhizobium sp. BR1-1-16]|uniref:DUF6931 family protein n=1 Tax=Mesorhizobium sp. BR1-1-16 TaxID=2876653 RepID=UPI001CCFA727|nr:hypothetical protein [Mesorhizobium sp. BR1-1-16]MBZ9938987.1 hypothetical protein [Mesorhizobium sp. BR1-1-16]
MGQAMVDGLRFRTARELYTACPSVRDAMTAAPDDRPSLDFCRGLLQSRVPEESITFCAHLLSGRAAVWWGHECLGHLTDWLDGRDVETLAMLRNWVGAPADPDCATALHIAASVDAQTPVSWLVQAAYALSEASSSAACEAARGVNTGVLAALARVNLEERAAVLLAFAEMGMQLAELEALRQTAGAAS